MCLYCLYIFLVSFDVIELFCSDCCFPPYLLVLWYTDGRFLVVVVAFSLCARIWGECSTIHSPPALFFSKVEISLCTLTLYARISPLAQQAEMTVTECSLMSCV